MNISRFAKFSWGVLAYTVFVILFGAFVRATGSGAGCGAHWPLCNGVVSPQPKQIQTVIEFTHRMMSGLLLILSVTLVVWAWRKYSRGSLLRWSSAAAIFFTITEALVGAGLVLYGWVATNTSVARAVSVPIHLVNTFLLLASVAVTAWWATLGEPEKLHFQGLTGLLVILGGLAILLLGASGAVTALGDTLFPSTSLAEGMAQDFSPTANFLIRMRVYHPGIGVSTGVYLLLATLWVRRQVKEPRLVMITNGLFGLYILQMLLGMINVALLAPVWMQIVHLFVSNLVWITYVLMGAVVFSRAIPFIASERMPGLGNQEIHDRVDRAERVG